MDPSELDLSYPCRWDYKVIGRDEQRIRAAVAEVLGSEPHELEASNRSAGGRYLSFRVSVELRDDAQRTRIFAGLRDHADVVYVL
ncbi:MAG: DUF493 domain-containing protein [Planctomycetota bacterium]